MTGGLLAMVLLIVFALGAAVGSFLNVVIARVPQGRSVVHPPSACPSCGVQIAPYDNIPICSWLVLRGRCRACREPISARYPLIEAATGLLWVAVTAGMWMGGLPWAIPLGLVMVSVAVAWAGIAWDRRRILAVHDVADAPILR